MLTAPEAKIVIETLAKRRAWLLKHLETDNPGPKEVAQTREAIAHLEAAMKKIGVQAKQASVSQQAAALASEGDLSRVRALIAEDDADSRALLTEILEDLHLARIDTVEDGTQALKQMFQADPPYQLVLCDWNMPHKNGLEVHTIMRGEPRFRDVVFMMVSAVSEADQIRNAITQGVNDYVVKPLDEDVLKRKILKAFAQAGAQARSA